MCDLSKDYQNIEYVMGGEVSVIFFGRSLLFDKDVAIKIFTREIASYEIDVYMKIIPVLRRAAPHLFLSALITFKDCPYVQSMEGVKRIGEEYHRMLEWKDDPVFRVLATLRYPETQTLSNLAETERNPSALLKIYFQVCAALYLLQSVHGMHNDLHTNNVLVRTHPSPITMQFAHDDVIYTLTTRHQVLMFDWDHAYFEALGPNLVLEVLFRGVCREFNMCNRFVRGKDLLQFSCYFAKLIDEEEFGEVFMRGADPMDLFLETVFDGKHEGDTFTPYCTLKPSEETSSDYESMAISQVLAALGRDPRIATTSVPLMYDSQYYVDLDLLS